jgi:8-oxo-dGTP diphosphatase
MTSPAQRQRPAAAVNTLIFKENQILLSRRLEKCGRGLYWAVGGHMELGESIKACALREIREECGGDLVVRNLRVVSFSNVADFLPSKQFLLVGLAAEYVSGTPQQTEPENQGPWGWFPVNNLPQPLFSHIALHLQAIKGGLVFYDDLEGQKR